MSTLPRFVVFALALAGAALAVAADKGKWISLFDGKTLKGWKQVDGTAKIEVRDGAIIGIVTEGALNTYIATEDTSFGDFIFECEFKCDPGINSGIQFRSRFAHGDIKRAYGYQYEIDPTPRALSAGLQEAGRRAWLTPTANKGEPRDSWVKAHGDIFKPGEWNTARIEARGRHLRTWLNGQLMADIEDKADVAIPRGFIGMQIHQTKDAKLFGREAAFRNLRIQRLD